MIYNDYALATFDQYAAIAREYNLCSRAKVSALALSDRALFDEVMELADGIYKCTLIIIDKKHYYPRLSQFYEGITRTNLLLEEFYSGEFGLLSQAHSSDNYNIHNALEKIKYKLAQLIKKLMRLSIASSKRDILLNITDMYIEMINMI